ncbi:MAG: pyridoxal phosphate-dependent aminotransferase, partial [Acidimicrobiales bacterium]
TLKQTEAPESLVVTRTFSKTWSMAGVRLGYCVAPPWMLPEFEKVILPYHLDSLKQIAGRIALRFRDEMEQRVAQISAERQRIADALSALGLDVFPSQANFLMFRTTECGVDGDELWHRLLAQSILVRNCSNWPGLADCLRVTVGTANENDSFIEALEGAIK